MNISSLISLDLPILSLQDSGERALVLMQEYRVFHLPLVQRDNYIALVSEDDLLDWDTPEEPLSLAEFVNFRPIIFEHMHPWDAARTAKEFNLSVLPIVNAQNHYMGMVTIEKLFDFITDHNGMKEHGAILILELEQRNYSLSEIARICESNNISILSTSLKTIDNTGLIWVTLKINVNDTQALVATFERFNYHVVDIFSSEHNDHDMRHHFDSFMHYLNM
jgi:acetoin utilization protein AcuB